MEMIKSLRLPSWLALLLIPGLGFSQVHLVEQEMSAVVPQTGVQWNSGITSYMGGLEYVVEGRTSLGLRVSRALTDTVVLNPTLPPLKSTVINPYAVFEFIEPGNLSIFSFALKAGFTWMDASGTGADLSSFERTIYSAGPIFGFRMQPSPGFAYIPTVGYEFQFTKWQRNTLIDGVGEFEEDNDFWHDVTAGVHLVAVLNEFHSLSFQPYASFLFGTGREAADLINVGLNVAYAWKL